MPSLPAISKFGPCITVVATLLAPPAIAGCNSGNVWKSWALSSSGCQADAQGMDALAVGDGAKATGYDSIAIGARAFAIGYQSTVIGQAAGPSEGADGSTAVGWLAGRYALGRFATAIGFAVEAKGANSIAIGAGDTLELYSAHANGYRSVAIGQMSSTGNAGTLTGFGLGDFGTSIGFNTHTAFAATAIGTDAQAKGDSASAVGRFSSAVGGRSLALGTSAVAAQARSVALGSSSVATVADTVSVGTATYRRRIVNVAAAINGTDVPNLTQVKALISAATASPSKLATLQPNSKEKAAFELKRELAELRAAVSVIQQRIDELESRGTLASAQ